jgi:hypothetical protein
MEATRPVGRTSERSDASHANGARRPSGARASVQGARGAKPPDQNAWWDPHWIQDRIIRKPREASGS